MWHVLCFLLLTPLHLMENKKNDCGNLHSDSSVFGNFLFLFRYVLISKSIAGCGSFSSAFRGTVQTVYSGMCDFTSLYSDPGLSVKAVTEWTGLGCNRYLGGYLVSQQQTGILTDQQERSNSTHSQHMWCHHGTRRSTTTLLHAQGKFS